MTSIRNYSKNYLRRRFSPVFFILCLFILGACENIYGDVCIEAGRLSIDEYGETNQRTAIVYARDSSSPRDPDNGSEWLDTTYRLRDIRSVDGILDDPEILNISGSVDVCPPLPSADEWYLIADTSSPSFPNAADFPTAYPDVTLDNPVITSSFDALRPQGYFDFRAGESILIKVKGIFSNGVTTYRYGQGLQLNLFFSNAPDATSMYINFDYMTDPDTADDYRAFLVNYDGAYRDNIADVTTHLGAFEGLNYAKVDVELVEKNTSEEYIIYRIHTNAIYGNAKTAVFFHLDRNYDVTVDDGSGSTELVTPAGDGNYSNNTEGYEIYVRQEGCKGSNGEYLIMCAGLPTSSSGGFASSLTKTNITKEYEYDITFGTSDCYPFTIGKLPGQSHNTLLSYDGTAIDPALDIHHVLFKIVEPLSPVYGAGLGSPVTNYEKNYADNSGEYQINIGTYVPPTAASSSGLFQTVFGGLITDLKNFMTPFIEDVFIGLEGDIGFNDLVRYAIIIYISWQGILIVSGADGQQKIAPYDVLIMLFKVGIALTLLSPTSYDFFSNYLLNAFIIGLEQLIALFNSGIYNETGELVDTGVTFMGMPVMQLVPNVFSTFAWADNLIQNMFAQERWLRVLALLFTGPLGFAFMLFLFIIFFKLIFIILHIAITYVYCVVGLTLSLAVAPIFIVSILFQWSQGLFDKWFKTVLSLAIKPLLLITVVLFFEKLILLTLDSILSYAICWQCVFDITIEFKKLNFVDIRICLIQWFVPWAEPTGNDIYGGASKVSFIEIIMLLIYVELLKKFIAWSGELTKAITGDYSASSGVDALAGQVKNAKLLGVVNLNMAENYLVSKTRNIIKSKYVTQLGLKLPLIPYQLYQGGKYINNRRRGRSINYGRRNLLTRSGLRTNRKKLKKFFTYQEKTNKNFKNYTRGDWK